jgi:hypothetical protein
MTARESPGAFSMIRSVLAAGLLLAIASPAAAQMPETEPLTEGLPCASADIVGLWESRVVTPNATTNALSKIILLDYMRFSPDGAMMYYGAGKPEADVRTIQKNLDEYDAVDGATYAAQMLSPGLLILYRDERPFQGFTCTIVKAAPGQPTMILSQLKGMTPVKRLQRRLD